jgi:hypothetical protein
LDSLLVLFARCEFGVNISLKSRRPLEILNRLGNALSLQQNPFLLTF